VRGERGGISAVTVQAAWRYWRNVPGFAAVNEIGRRPPSRFILSHAVVVALNERQQLRHQQRRILNVCKLLPLLQSKVSAEVGEEGFGVLSVRHRPAMAAS